MKEYPKTFGFNECYIGQQCIGFEKYDGSNLRFCYNRKSKKWYKFGTRRHLFQEGDPEYGASLPVFFNKYATGLEKVFHDTKSWRNAENMIVFAEYFGPHSFSGQHDPQRLNVESNDPKDLILFDVNIHRKGILSANEFVQYFGHLPIAEIKYQGIVTNEFFHDVRNGKYNVNEGVMVKGGSGHNAWMFKIKTLDYLQRLKKLYGDRWDDYWE